MALVGADAAKAALSKLNAECALPLGYAPDLLSLAPRGSSSNNSTQDSAGNASGPLDTSGGRAGSAGRGKKDRQQDDGSVVETLQRLVADVSRQPVWCVGCTHCIAKWGCAQLHALTYTLC